MDRRRLLGSLFVGLVGLVVFGWPKAEAGPRGFRRGIRVRRHFRRRFRRRVAFRMFHGRRLWVVPVGLGVGWELMHENRVVVVKETKFIEVDGERREVAIVQDSDGKTEQVEMSREDTPENSKNLEGSVIPEGDTKTPGVDSESDEDEPKKK